MDKALRARIMSSLPPRVQWYIRGQKNSADLFGLHAPGRALADLVPKGLPAVDVGANRGIYSYWIAKSASTVISIEPNPHVFSYLVKAAPSRVSAVNVALSNAPGTATLSVPEAGNGEATLRSDVKAMRTYEVECRTLDSFDLSDLGFLKIDVEGHEMQVLAGGQATITRCRPVVFIELEERHREGAVESVRSLFLDRFSYSSGEFMQNGKLYPISAFDPTLHQSLASQDQNSSAYVSNFLFRP